MILREVALGFFRLFLLVDPLGRLEHLIYETLEPVAVLGLVSSVISSTKAYLLTMANIAFYILEFFMMSLWIKDGALSPFLKNITIDLSSTARMMFLLLQNRWI
jgi:hypothetical protein